MTNHTEPYPMRARDDEPYQRTIVSFTTTPEGGLMCFSKEHHNGAIAMWGMTNTGWEIIETFYGPPQHGTTSEHHNTTLPADLDLDGTLYD
jgi:hypothetical protein